MPYPAASPGWPDEALALIERAVARHGGWDRYQRLLHARFTVNALGGPLPFAKGLHRTHPMPSRVEVSPHAWQTVFLDYPVPGQQGVFARGDVRLAGPGTEGRSPPAGRDHRRTFSGLGRLRRWDPLDAVYFFGYAMCTYLAVPFVLRQTSFVSLRRVRDDGRELSGVVVDFPDRMPSHCKRQAFYFDDTGLLRRHDYTAEIVGAWATGAHYSDDYVTAGGLMLATRRRVVATVLGRATPIPVLHARLGEASITTG